MINLNTGRWGLVIALAVSVSLASCGKDDQALLLPLATAALGSESGGPGSSPADTGASDTPASGEGSTGVRTEVTGGGSAESGSSSSSSTSSSTSSSSTSSSSTSSSTSSGSAGSGETGSSDSKGGTDGDDDDDDGEDDADGSDDGDDGDDGSETGTHDGGADKACSARTVTLDSSKGRWFQTEEKSLSGVATDKVERQAIKAKIRALRKQVKAASDKATKKALRASIADLRASLGWGAKQKGIHTYWQNQALYLRVRNNCKEGYYKLKIVAKNIHGPLPSFFSRFNVSVHNETSNRHVGGVFIKASDRRYRRGRMLVYLKEGDTDLKLTWTNDAYKKGVYDANIQIKKIKLQYKRKVRLRRHLVRRAHQYCYTKGRWFWDDKTVRTYWKNQTIGFCFKNLKPGKYRVIVRAKNYGKLPDGYDQFKVMIGGDGVADETTIPAHETKFKRGTTVLDLRGGDVMIGLTWLNDKWVPAQGKDANIQIRKVRLKRIGDSERSALSAYLGGAGAKNGVAVMLLLVLIGALGLLTIRLVGGKRGHQA